VEFAGASATRSVSTGIFLLETKSANANGVADKILRALHQHPTEGCSKYCVAMATLQEVSKFNKFRTALRKLDIMPTPLNDYNDDLKPKRGLETATDSGLGGQRLAQFCSVLLALVLDRDGM